MSVCLSVTRRYSVETVIDYLNLFSSYGSHAIVVIPWKTAWHHSDVNPLMVTLNAGSMKTRSSAVVERPRDASYH